MAADVQNYRMRCSWVQIALLFVAGIAGCHCAPHAPAMPQPDPVVDVGGHVRHAQAMRIPDRGLSLRQAVERAGGLAENLVPSRALVALRRATGEPFPKTTFIPWGMVRDSTASEILLLNDDVVRVVDYAETTLNAAVARNQGLITDVGSKFLVEGMVAASRVHKTRTAVAQAASADGALQPERPPLSMIGHIVSPAPHDPGLRRSADANVVVVSRRSAAGVGIDEFVLPINVNAIPDVLGAANSPANRGIVQTAPAATQEINLDQFNLNRPLQPRRPRRAGEAPAVASPQPTATSAATRTGIATSQPTTGAPPPANTTASSSAAGATPPVGDQSSSATVFAAASAPGLPLNLFPIAHQDQIAVTRLEFVPVVLQSIVKSALRNPDSNANADCCVDGRCMKDLTDCLNVAGGTNPNRAKK